MGGYISLSIEMMLALNSGNNAFYSVFMPLHHPLGFFGRGDHLTPMTLPGSAPGHGYLASAQEAGTLTQKQLMHLSVTGPG